MQKAIETTNLGKRYPRRELGAQRYQTLRDTLLAWTRGGAPKVSDDHFWALRHAELSVNPGEVLGVIGPNGAGKSTLLKLLSRVTAPTEGSFTLRGRVASLLEVGTGFHPELTGRENIFLSGAVMGMKRREIARRFDEIVDFSGVEQFLDLPVKRYSSGMYVRLGFAIAAHLQAEILLVDEVLAVGDAAFQKKCLGKIGDVAGDGRTVLFVSHNLAMLGQICRESILIDEGKIMLKETTDKVITQYREQASRPVALALVARRGVGKYLLTEIEVYSLSGAEEVAPVHGEPLVVSLSFSADQEIDPAAVRIDLRIDSVAGNRLIWMSTAYKDCKIEVAGKKLNFIIKSCPLNIGEYSISFFSYYKGQENDCISNCKTFSISKIDYDKYEHIPKRKADLVVEYSLAQ